MSEREKVFVLTEEPFHDNSEIVGVFLSLSGAMSRYPDRKWETWENGDSYFTFGLATEEGNREARDVWGLVAWVREGDAGPQLHVAARDLCP